LILLRRCALGYTYLSILSNKEDLIDTLVPYFKTGLENNEFCVWILSEPLKVEDAKEFMRMTVSLY